MSDPFMNCRPLLRSLPSENLRIPKGHKRTFVQVIPRGLSDYDEIVFTPETYRGGIEGYSVDVLRYMGGDTDNPRRENYHLGNVGSYGEASRLARIYLLGTHHGGRFD